jgi:hypothetical protein
MPGLADTTTSTSAWTIERRNQEYTVILSVCTVDDDQDGFGDHTGGTFCGGSTGTSDANPDDYKRLSIELQWKDGSITRTVRQAGVVNNESAASGPDIEIIAQDPNSDLITTNESSIDFDVETDPDAVAARWAVDGVVKETETLSGTSWSFSWRINGGPDGHVPDGTYVISVTAFDAEDRPGVTRSRTIRLNRDVPSKVENVFGGWNARLNIVDLQWTRNVEPDILGYRVYRRTGSNPWELVPGCSFDAKPDATTCSDESPPAGTAIDYRVVALDEDPFSQDPREGVEWDVLVATRSANQPNSPASLTATVQDADVLLTWPTADPFTPPYTGSTVIFYRVYRGGTQLADRIGRTGQQDLLSFLVANGASASDEYWVTSVDTNFSESVPVGPVALP